MVEGLARVRWALQIEYRSATVARPAGGATYAPAGVGHPPSHFSEQHDRGEWSRNRGSNILWISLGNRNWCCWAVDQERGGVALHNDPAGQVDRLAVQAANSLGTDPEGLGHAIIAAGESAIPFTIDVIEAATRTANRHKIDALERFWAHSIKDDARPDEDIMMLRNLTEVEAPHVRDLFRVGRPKLSCEHRGGNHCSAAPLHGRLIDLGDDRPSWLHWENWSRTRRIRACISGRPATASRTGANWP